MYEKCFYFLLNSGFSEKMTFLRKLKPQHPPALEQLFRPHIFNFLQKKLLAPKKRAEAMHSI